MASNVMSTGVPVCDDTFLLRVSKDKMYAVLVPKDENAGDPDCATLGNDLDMNGIVHGLLPKPVASKGGFVVAKGDPVVNGENAIVKAHVKPSVVRAPKVKDASRDRVDFRELGCIVNVAVGQLLLQKIPPTEGTSGTDVFGRTIYPKHGKDIKMRVGPGVTLSDDGMKVTADVEGKFVVGDGKAAVYEEHVVSENVDLSTGNITFAGKSLTINGLVQPGFKVKCKGDIYISKGVNSAAIIAGGAIQIKGGVVGQDARVKAMGNITIDFSENGPLLETKESLYVDDVIIQSQVKVGKDVKALKGKGILIGGEFIVGGSVYCKELGSDAEVVTNVTVGVDPVLEEKKKKFAEDKEIWPEKMNDILRNTTGLKKMKTEQGGKLPPEKEELLKKFNAMLPDVMEKVNDLKIREEELNEEISAAADKAIHVFNAVFPGVTVKIGKGIRTINLEESSTVILLDRKSLQIHCTAMTSKERDAVGSLIP